MRQKIIEITRKQLIKTHGRPPSFFGDQSHRAIRPAAEMTTNQKRARVEKFNENKRSCEVYQETRQEEAITKRGKCEVRDFFNDPPSGKDKTIYYRIAVCIWIYCTETRNIQRVMFRKIEEIWKIEIDSCINKIMGNYEIINHYTCQGGLNTFMRT